MSLTIRKDHRLALGVAAALLACLWLAARADANARVYWAHMNGSTLESVPADGGESPQVLVSGAANPAGVAVDDTHVYWANYSGEWISRANIDGSGVEKEFISGIKADALAVAEGHIYWTDAETHSIGRANLDGGKVDPGFIEGVGAFFGLAANSEHLYWGNAEGEAIGRANLDGSEVEPEFIKPSGALTPYGVAVDSGHVYWANSQNNSIGRANLAGGEVEEAFIPEAHPAGVAVDAGHIYWGYAIYSGALGRANIDGSEIDYKWQPAGSIDAFGVATTRPEATLTANPSQDVALGAGTIHATAALGGANAPTGTATISLYGPGDETCSGAPVATETVPVSGNGSYRSAAFTPTRTGSYRWRASYSGDAENNPLHGPCGDPVKVTDPPAPAPPKTCAPVTASAATFTPTPRSGKLVPGVRALIMVGAPSQLQVTARLTYRLHGKAHNQDLGSHSVQATTDAKLRLPLPAGSRRALPVGTRVKVELRIAATADNLPGCATASSSVSTFRTKVVKVLSHGA